MSGEISDTREIILSKYKWKKVQAPKTWHPKELGAELVGFYGGRTMRQGSFGQYEVVLVHVPQKGSFIISGIKIIQLMDAAIAEIGDPVRIVWNGTEALDNDRHMKLFEVYVTDGEALAAEDLPSIPAQQ
jgi:hypothetical protein